jgi:hypothetical protein
MVKKPYNDTGPLKKDCRCLFQRFIHVAYVSQILKRLIVLQ